ncbi:peptide MFS transporter [Flavobacterium sp. GT3R68]|uniref:peptide MFS transporter n=1 Tax=Flavobacterium sp. GT3R68 TaxID=2594437 RepID=UPI000F86B504|nr:peptide MFS transporter [Flavobacterium sp. GT3R68]RTY92439.1 MFS transporter [Flavobacterium sp. GSN2]TRW94064.1 peptide MFS transporter [Flavobacterium sp. GT3R68]
MEHSLTLEEIQNFKGKYPKQLWYLFLVEMWERFCFYGMRGVLTIFMADQILGLALSDKDANLKYGAIQAFVYAFTFIGGIFADKILGFKKSLLFGGSVMILGNLIIAFSPQVYFYLGITLSIIGTGFFKPNISSMVGELYKEGDPRRDAGFGLFYSGINIGALLGGAVCVYLGTSPDYGWSYAFLSAAIVMIIGLITFILTKKSLGPIGDTPNPHLAASKRTTMEITVYACSLLSIPLIYMMIKNTDYTDYFMYLIGPLAILYFFYETFKVKDKKAQKKLLAAFVFILFSVIFWAFFEQSGGSLALFAKDNLHHNLLFFEINPNIVNNTSNSLFVIIFSPLIGLLWLAMAKKKIEPNTVIKFGIGFLFLAAAFYVFYYTRFFADVEGLTSLNIFTLAYLIITFGELCLSPIGLSIMTKLSPKRLSGMMMGMWFLASAYGQYAAGLLGAGMSSPDENASLITKLQGYTDGYYQLAIYALIAGILLIVVSPLIKKLMQEVK